MTANNCLQINKQLKRLTKNDRLLTNLFTNINQAYLYFATGKMKLMKHFAHDKPFLLESGATLPGIEISYYTYKIEPVEISYSCKTDIKHSKYTHTNT